MHPHGDAEIVQHGTSFELRPRSGSVADGVKIDVPQKAMNASSEELSEEVAARRLQNFKRNAQFDPNMPLEELDAIDDAVEHHDVKGENALVNELVENSPYPEVYSALIFPHQSH